MVKEYLLEIGAGMGGLKIILLIAKVIFLRKASPNMGFIVRGERSDIHKKVRKIYNSPENFLGQTL